MYKQLKQNLTGKNDKATRRIFSCWYHQRKQKNYTLTEAEVSLIQSIAESDWFIKALVRLHMHCQDFVSSLNSFMLRSRFSAIHIIIFFNTSRNFVLAE